MPIINKENEINELVKKIATLEEDKAIQGKMQIADAQNRYKSVFTAEEIDILKLFPEPAVLPLMDKTDIDNIINKTKIEKLTEESFNPKQTLFDRFRQILPW